MKLNSSHNNNNDKALSLSYRNLFSARMVTIRTLLLVLLLLPAAVHAVDYYQSQHTELFPPNDEYDSKILDTSTIYGSPYGGFSRATRSRLAALPLRLPNIAVLEDEEEEVNEDNNNNNEDSNNDVADQESDATEDHANNNNNSNNGIVSTYMQTTDSAGRGYVCKVYLEDDLTQNSVDESMFDDPQMRQKHKKHKRKKPASATPTTTPDSTLGDQYDEHHPAEGENVKEEEEEEVQDVEEDFKEPPRYHHHHSAHQHDARTLAKAHNTAIHLMETQRRLQKLQGVCSQIHLGWWSYEWCFEHVVTQFHIHVDSANSELELRDVTSLGKFASRKFHIPDEHNLHEMKEEDDPDSENEEEVAFTKGVNKFAEDEPELARVLDEYETGDTCEATGTARHTKVKYFCCSDRIMERYKGPVLRNGNPVASKIVSIVSLVEDPKEVCSYTITVCTPLLCEDVKSDDTDGLLYDIQDGSMLKHNSRKKRASSHSPSAPPSSSIRRTASKTRHHAKPRKENETIRDILDRTLGPVCIQSTTSGWWSYEYCHRKHVRQFHESISINVETGMASSGTEDIYMLGYYDKELDAFDDDDEWKYVVNKTIAPGAGGMTDTNGGAAGGKNNNNNGAQSVAAYFWTEYTGGDVCDDLDVTDAAVRAGAVNVKSHTLTERASTVRYSCGSSYDIYVNEDHTCHYIVEITIPDLCHHPFFRAPVAKKRVVKCLPVEDTNEWDH